MLKNNQIIPVLFAAVMIMFTGCSKSDDENVAPKKKAETATPKTAAEIEAETIAEFEEIIGDGVGNTKFETAYLTGKKISEMTKDDWDIVVYNPEENKRNPRVFKFKNREYYDFEDDESFLKGSVFTLTKEDGVFTLIAKREDEKTMKRSGIVPDNEEYFLKVSYDTENKLITILQEGYTDREGVMTFGGIIVKRYTAVPLSSLPKVSRNSSGSSRSIVARQSSSSSTTFTGVHQVDVELKGISWTASIAAGRLQPKGSHYVKFTPKTVGSDTIRVQFCDASGNISGNAAADYNYSTTHHFWKNKMPMSLNLDEVYFVYSSSTNDITKSNTAVVARARANSNPKGFVPWFLSSLTTQNSDSSAKIITTTGNSTTSYKIEIKLGFKVNFHCVISK